MSFIYNKKKELKTISHSLLIFGIFVGHLSIAVADNEKQFELSNTEDQDGGWWAPKRVIESKHIADGIFPVSFLNSPVGQMVNAGKNASLRVGEKLTNYSEVASKICPPTMANDESSKHCYTVPKDLENAIQKGQDAPIFLIDELHKKSFDYWSQFQAPSAPPKVKAIVTDHRANVIIDINSIKELNLRAAKLWTDLVQCNGGSSEKARVGFFQSNSTQVCNDGTSSTKMKALMELGFNFHEFLKDTLPLTDLDAYLDSSEARAIFKNPHPLITEFAILNWSIFFNHIHEDKFKNSELLTATMFQYSAVEQDIRRTEMFGTVQGLPAVLKPMQEGAVILFKAVVNDLIFLSLINYDDLKYSCARYGLWPALNRGILYTQLLQFYSGNIYSELNYLNDSVVRNCGDKVDFVMSPDWSGVYGKYFQSHLMNMRYMYIDYIGNQFKED